MSRELKPVGELALTRFWGGKDCGPCVQITDPFTQFYLSLTFEQAKELGEALVNIEDRPECHEES